MCDPVSIGLVVGGTLLSGGGAFINSSAQNNAIKAQNQQNRIATDLAESARQREQTRQDEFTGQQRSIFADLAAAADPEALRRNAETEGAARESATRDAAAQFLVPVGSGATGQGGEGPLARVIGARISDDLDRTERQLSAQSLLSALGSGQQGVQRTLQGGAGGIDRVNSFRRGSADVAGQEQRIAPAVVTPNDSLFGDLLQALGSGLSTAGGLSSAGGSAAPFSSPLPVPRPG